MYDYVYISIFLAMLGYSIDLFGHHVKNDITVVIFYGIHMHSLHKYFPYDILYTHCITMLFFCFAGYLGYHIMHSPYNMFYTY